jgi:hypothetical protein
MIYLKTRYETREAFEMDDEDTKNEALAPLDKKIKETLKQCQELSEEIKRASRSVKRDIKSKKMVQIKI